MLRVLSLLAGRSEGMSMGKWLPGWHAKYRHYFALGKAACRNRVASVADSKWFPTLPKCPRCQLKQCKDRT